MTYHLAISRVHVWGDGIVRPKNMCDCKEARGGCRPAFVFSALGQIGWRQSLNHLKKCNKRCCQSLRKEVWEGMHEKLSWLMEEDKLLGCVQIQPLLYGAKRVTCQRRDFSLLAHHLAHCPKDSCAQLRRALLLTVRDQIGPLNMPQG